MFRSNDLVFSCFKSSKVSSLLRFWRWCFVAMIEVLRPVAAERKHISINSAQKVKNKKMISSEHFHTYKLTRFFNPRNMLKGSWAKLLFRKSLWKYEGYVVSWHFCFNSLEVFLVQFAPLGHSVQHIRKFYKNGKRLDRVDLTRMGIKSLSYRNLKSASDARIAQAR